MAHKLISLLVLGILLAGTNPVPAHERAERREKRRESPIKDNPSIDRNRTRDARKLIPQQFSGWNVRNARAALLPDRTALRIFTEGPLIAIIGNNSLERLQPPLRVALQLRTPNNLPVVFSWIEPSRQDDVFRSNDEAIVELSGNESWQIVNTVLTPTEPVRNLRMLLITSAPTPVDIATLVIADSVGRTASFDFGKNEARPAWVNGGYLRVDRE
jgi:hypothetical protein